eukprot:3926532-Pleurochrysis_carterae.AAC.1
MQGKDDSITAAVSIIACDRRACAVAQSVWMQRKDDSIAAAVSIRACDRRACTVAHTDGGGGSIDASANEAFCCRACRVLTG